MQSIISIYPNVEIYYYRIYMYLESMILQLQTSFHVARNVSIEHNATNPQMSILNIHAHKSLHCQIMYMHACSSIYILSVVSMMNVVSSKG